MFANNMLADSCNLMSVDWALQLAKSRNFPFLSKTLRD
jgi:hypothetical protein